MIEIIPAIDLMDGQCVRLTKGDYATRKTYSSDPTSMARSFEDAGFRRLHLVDLDGARSGHVVNHRVLESIASHTALTVDFGGGVKTDEDLQTVLDCGAAMVTVGSLAVKRPELFAQWIESHGADRFVLGADARDGKISVSGWEEDSDRELIDFIKEYMQRGIRHVLCTDISRDGMLAGPATSLYREVLAACPTCQLIASGGISSLDDIRELEAAGVPATVVGKAIYEGKVRLESLQAFNAQNV